MVARGIFAGAPLQLADRKQEQSDAEQLQEQRKRLLNSPPLFGNDRGLRLCPESQRRDSLASSRSAQQIKRYDEAETAPKIARNSSGLKFSRNTIASPYSHHRAEDCFFDRDVGGESRHIFLPFASPESGAGAHTHRMPACTRASLLVRIDFEMGAGFSVDQVEFACPGRLAIFRRPDVDQQEFVAKIGDVLQRPLGVVLIEEIRNDQRQAALRVIRRELPGNLEKIAGTASTSRSFKKCTAGRNR